MWMRLGAFNVLAVMDESGKQWEGRGLLKLVSGNFASLE